MNDQWGSTKSVIALMIGDNEERRVFQKDWNTLFRVRPAWVQSIG
ncbi:hypothetical protein P9857_13460 [Anoxybacillus geothermalis]|nr:hypothetical protein [Anoxybacillus geothermalis]